jgi:hypothetical protein
MSKKRLFLALAFFVLLALVGWWSLPFVVNALPGVVRARLPHQVIQLVETPLPAALPAPVARATPQITIPAILLPTATATQTATAVPSPTAMPTTVDDPEATPAATATLPPTNTPTLTPSPTATAVPLPTAVRLEGISVIPQKLNNCGPTNLTINLNYYGRDVDQLAVADVIKPNYDDRNVSPSDLELYVREHTDMGITVGAGGNLDVLKRLVAAGYPVVVEKGLIPSEWEGWMGHYLTVVGYDDAQQAFVTLDTFLGPWDSSGLWIGYEEMDEFWRHFNYTFFVVYPPEEETAVHTIIGPDLLDPLTMWQRAAQQAQTDIANKPEDAFAWFNLGTNLTQLGYLTEEQAFFSNAAAAYDQARTLGLPWRMLWYQFGPYDAYLANGRTDDIFTLTDAMFSSFGGQNVEETYYYRGRAKLQLGDTTGAREDFNTALQLNPTYTAAQGALAILP